MFLRCQEMREASQLNYTKCKFFSSLVSVPAPFQSLQNDSKK